MFPSDEMNLMRPPFTGEVDEISFFPYPSLTETVAKVRRYVAGDYRVLLVTGEAGSGKTLLVKQILALDETRWKVANLSLEHGASLRVYAMEMGELPTILIDDAHLLEPEVLASLVKLTSEEEGERRLQQLVIFGAPRLSRQVDTLRHLMPPRDSVMEVGVPAMEMEEVRTYISGHLRSAGHSGVVPFTDGQIERIHTLSKGLPGRVNREAAKELSRIKEKSVPAQKKGLFGRFFGR